MRSAADFAAVTRRGHRARCGGLVVYLLSSDSAEASRLGLIVGKSVGGSVVRHQVSRRLRAQLAERLERVPVGARLVVRALPGSESEDSAALGRDLDRAFNRFQVGSR